MSTGGKNCWGKPVTDEHLIRFGGGGELGGYARSCVLLLKPG